MYSRPPRSRRAPFPRVRGSFGPPAALALALAGCGTATPGAVGSTAQAITVTPDFELEAPVLVAADGAYSLARSAFNGTEHLVVWIDPSGALTMTRVTAAGVVRDPLGVAIGAAVMNSGAQWRDSAPAVASDGAGFLVAWMPRAGEVRAARIDPAGAVLDPGGFVVTTSAASTAGLAAAGDAAGYLVAWRDVRNVATTGVDYFAARVSRDGAVRDPAGRPVLVAPGDQGAAAVATSGVGWLLACQDEIPGPVSTSDLRFGRLDASGAALDGVGRRVAAAIRNRSAPAVGWNGGSYLLAWADATLSGALTPGVYAQVVSPAGAVVGAETVAIGMGSGQVFPAVAPSPGGWLVTGVGSFPDLGSAGVASVRVSAAGATLDQPARIYATPNAGGRPTVTGVGGAAGYLLTYITRGVNPAARRLAADGSAGGEPFELNFRANTQGSPNVAFDGASFVATWSDLRAGSEGYRVRRLSPAGAPLDAAPTLLPTASAPVAVASRGAGSLLAWHDAQSSDRRTLTAPYSLAGALGAGMVVDTGSFIRMRHAPAMVAGGGYLLAWGESGGAAFGSRFAVRAQPLNAAGAMRSAPAGLSDTAYSSPQVSFDGANFLVSWLDSPPDPAPRCISARAARVTPAGDRLEATSIILSGAACDVEATAAASDGTSHLVVWTSPAGVFAARVSPEGAVLDAPARSLSSTAARAPAVTFDGAAFVVAWQDARSGNADVYAGRVSRAGAVLDPGGSPVARESVAEEEPRLASAGAGRSLVLYTRRASGAVRVRGRFITFDTVDGGTAGPADASATDAGSDAAIVTPPVDAGRDVPALPDVALDAARDAGAPDAPAGDAPPALADAGAADATASVDAAAVAPPADEGGGCSAGPARRRSPWSALGILALALPRRRRSGRDRRGDPPAIDV